MSKSREISVSSTVTVGDKEATLWTWWQINDAYDDTFLQNIELEGKVFKDEADLASVLGDKVASDILEQAQRRAEESYNAGD